MEQNVIVRRLLPENMAEVMRIRESACSGDCHKCSGCGAAKQAVIFTAGNPVGAKPGDLVVVQSDTATVLKGAVLLYLLPLLTFLTGYIMGESLWGWGIVCGILGFVLGMVPIKLYDRHLEKTGTVYTIKAIAERPKQPKFTEKGDNEVD